MTPAPALLAFALAAMTAGDGSQPAGPSTWDLVFLAEDRPVFLRLRAAAGERPFSTTWPESVRAIHACLDRDGDGKLTAKEADKDALTALVRLVTGDAAAAPRGELDADPKDGVVSIDELTEAIRPALGPFHIAIGRLATSRTDALFDHLDRDKDGQLTRSELAAIAGSIRRLDLDDNEMIGPDELEPFAIPVLNVQAPAMAQGRGRFIALPPVIETVAGESSLRLARALLKKYDRGRDDDSTRPDGKLSQAEFAVDPDAFAAADRNHDGMLDTEDLRRFLGKTPIDLVLDVTFDARGHASARSGEGARTKGAQARQVGDGDVEFAVGQARLDLHVDDGTAAADHARRAYRRRFQALDANKDGYLESKELTADNAPGSPLAGLTRTIDRDGDGKLYPKELDAFADRLAEVARGRLVLTVSDQGRAIFGILDLDRDRRLGAREVMRTVERVTSWDSDRDGRVAAEEIPYHFQVNIARGELTGLASENIPATAPGSMATTSPLRPASGPDWFRKMDRNHDGDVSRREFLGPREAFERLDRDKDGLIGADEAATIDPGTAKAAGGRTDR